MIRFSILGVQREQTSRDDTSYNITLQTLVQNSVLIYKIFNWHEMEPELTSKKFNEKNLPMSSSPIFSSYHNSKLYFIVHNPSLSPH